MAVELKGFSLGGVHVAMPVVLAPLAGYSDVVYRRLCRRLGCAYATTEMMLDRCVEVGGRQNIQLLASGPDDHPVAGQLIGNDPVQMARSARLLAGRGFDVIDLNFACPVNKALRRRRGGWLMKEPARVVELVRAVVAAVDRPVTLKVRRRFAENDHDEAFWQLAGGARDVGAAGLIVHARSVERKYAGPSDWEFLRRVRQQFPDWVVIGSGDVLQPADALAMFERTGVDGVCAARGALGNPWFFRQVADLAAGREPHRPDLAEQRHVLLEHFRAACEFYGPKKGPRIMRKWGMRYSHLHTQPKRLRMAFVEVGSAEDWLAVLDRYYADRIH